MKTLYILLSFLVLTGCSRNNEVLRITSPSGKIDAVVYESESNLAFVECCNYEVHLVEHKSISSNDILAVTLKGAMRNTISHGVNVRWQDDNKLVLEYSHAKSVNQHDKFISIANNTIEVTLKDDIVDTLARSGTMLFDIKSPTKPKINL
jgi:hypothetical protein